MKKHPLYRTWVGIKERCSNPNRHDYYLYGGKGIKVCAEWVKSFVAFASYMGEKPTPTHSIDRFPNKNGNYEPGNVRWATKYEQIENSDFKHKPKLTEAQRQEVSLKIFEGQNKSQLAKEYSISKSLITRLSKREPETC